MAVTNWTEWVAPGSATAAVIVVVLIFLRQMRYMQKRYDTSLNTVVDKLTNKLDEAIDGFKQQVRELDEKREKNEDRRMLQIQSLFDKMMTVTTQSVTAISDIRHGFVDFTRTIKEEIKIALQSKDK